MKRICLYCPNPLKNYGTKAHLICHKREVTRRMKGPGAGGDPNLAKHRRWQRWMAERAEAERAMRMIRKEES